MQYQSPSISHSPSHYTCPPSGLGLKTPVFAFNTGLYDPGPNEIDPLDLSCLSDDRSAKTNAPSDFTLPTLNSAIVWPPFERRRDSSASYSRIQTPLFSDYTEPPSTFGSTPSPVLLLTPRSPQLHDLRPLHPLRDKQRFTPDLYRTISSEDENDVDTRVSGNNFVGTRRAEEGNSPPARVSTSTVRPDTPRRNTFLKSRLSHFSPPLMLPRREAAPSGRLLDAFKERMAVDEAIRDDNDDVNVKSGYSDEPDDDSRVFAPRNLLRRGAVCRASTGHHGSSMKARGIPLLCIENRPDNAPSGQLERSVPLVLVPDIPPRLSCPTPSGIPTFTSVPYIHDPDVDKEGSLNDDRLRPEGGLSFVSNVSHTPITNTVALQGVYEALENRSHGPRAGRSHEGSPWYFTHLWRRRRRADEEKQEETRKARKRTQKRQRAVGAENAMLQVQ